MSSVNHLENERLGATNIHASHRHTYKIPWAVANHPYITQRIKAGYRHESVKHFNHVVHAFGQGGRPINWRITTNFTMPSIRDSQHCKVFLDVSMLHQAMVIVNNPGIHRLSKTMIHGQLRAIRSKFHTSDAYISCRATGPLTMPHLHQL
ncbi:hypothetical protein EC973_001035 [Apophysomyces ossiformis]|uniref:Uncharacterized protein n=1 Tax=Apophysomyces ossiformis TaxID=679940 RepID=A0A8H7ETH0_9FUNG|nr:hypothetical protein EC973_001035 [Apophysomyces ossiformis]